MSRQGQSSNNRHTILLIQVGEHESSRTYGDFDTISAAIDAIIKMFEDRLKKLNPTAIDISYDISDLFNYMDDLLDICALIFDNNIGAYIPEDRESIKQRTFNYLRNQSG
ncbi:unnamed protein product [Heterosigma akashiwo]|eukprot:CAMPEP_0194569580 /NCGR_PEP_ID=MMETSP0292-20121207/7237_1 /TAXON_ID=39354 /ORGANISM="Heterosigma akashiwo, Strain CCMP2393" /LENGTH=109 /DNA_ID=CAMNT_0039419855 /DNA_START=79 /DNA_END=411 /DNA_ORIENTATION=+